MEQCLELGEGQHQRIDGGADIADISHVADRCQSNARRNVHMIQKAPSTPAWSCPQCRLAIQGEQSPIIRMPLTKPIGGEVDQYEALTMFG